MGRLKSQNSISTPIQSRFLFGVDIERHERSRRLIFLASLVLCSYLCYGYLQELIFTIEGFHFGWYLTLIQFSSYSLFSLSERFILGEGFDPRRASLKSYASVSLFMVAAMGFGNSSLALLNYPTQVLLKSSKLIPVMLGGVFILKRSFSLPQLVSCLFLVFGCAMMVLGDVTVRPEFNFKGIILVLGSLFSDAFTNNLQEKEFKTKGVSYREMLLFCHGFGCVYLTFITLFTNQMFDGFTFCLGKPSVYLYIELLSLCGYIGVTSVFGLIKQFDSFVAITITTLRKSMTIIFSFWFFQKPFTVHYFFAILLVFVGLFIQIFEKNPELFSLSRFKSSKQVVSPLAEPPDLEKGRSSPSPF